MAGRARISGTYVRRSREEMLAALEGDAAARAGPLFNRHGSLERDGRVNGGLRPSAPESRMPIARDLVTSFRDLPDRLGEQRAEPAAVAYCLDLRRRNEIR